MDFQVPSHILGHLYVFYVESNITAVERIFARLSYLETLQSVYW